MKPIIRMLAAFAACVLGGCNRDSQAPDVTVTEQNFANSDEPRLSYSGPLEPLNAYRGKELAKLDEDLARNSSPASRSSSRSESIGIGSTFARGMSGSSQINDMPP